MRYGALIFLHLLFIGIRSSAIAQRLVFKNYTSSDGLISNNVRHVFQDSKGFLWIGTWEGLSRYNGHQFSNFTVADGLSGYMINDLYESKDGLLYIVTNNGNVDVRRETGRIQRAVQTKSIVNRFLKLPSGRLLVTTDEDGIYEFHNDTLVKPSQAFPRYTYSNMIRLDDSLFLVGSDDAIQVMSNDCQLWTEVKGHTSAFIECTLYMDSKKRIWVGRYGTGLGLISLADVKSRRPTFLNVPAPFNIPFIQRNHVSAMYEDVEGVIWIGTPEGLVKINPDGSYRVITINDGLVENNITCIFQDREKNMWFGTSLGLSKLVTKSAIRIYTVENGLSSANLYFTYPLKNGYLLASSTTGLQVFDIRAGAFKPITKNTDNVLYTYVDNTNPLVLYGDRKILPFDTSALILGTKSLFPVEHHPFYSCIINKKGNFFFGDSYRLCFYMGPDDNPDTIVNYRPTNLLIDKNDCLWVGTWNDGLFRVRYTTEGDKIKILAKDHFLPNNAIRAIFEDSKGNIWIGTRYHGAYFLRNGSETLLSIDQTKGLTSNFIKGIREDKLGNMWLAFSQGLDKLIMHDTGYRIFNFSRVHNYFASIASFEFDENNLIWLATGQGLVQIDDGNMENLAPLPVYITTISSPDSTYPVNTASLNLTYNHNQLQFEFAAPGFINEKQISYSYRLLGSSNTDWSQPSNEHSVSYANLQPGSYRFEVRNKGWNGEWGKATSFEFMIRPPFWQTWWFIAGIALVAGAVIYWIVKRRIKGIRKEGELKQKIAETEMMALRAQMNPHFIFNCLNAIDNLVQTNQKEKATTYLARFARLIRSVLDSSKNNVVPFQNDYESLRLYLQMEQFRCNNKFSYELNADEELLHSDYKLPPLLVQPFVENAIHHGLLNKQTGDRKLIITAALEADHIKYTVVDNGVGRAKATEIKELNKPDHQSYGVAITTERIHLYNKNTKSKDIIITDLSDNGTPAGTKVEIRLKIADNK